MLDHLCCAQPSGLRPHGTTPARQGGDVDRAAALHTEAAALL